MYNAQAYFITIGLFLAAIFFCIVSYDAGTINGAKIAYDCYTNAADVDVCQSRLEDIIWPE